MTEATTIERAAVAALLLSALPPIGQPLEGGMFCGLTTKPDGTHCAVVLLIDKPASDLTWKKACEWATSIGGELPSRPVASMLFANAKDQFEERWHWTNEESSASYAWYCTFYGGYVDYSLKSYEGRARAVRLIPVRA